MIKRTYRITEPQDEKVKKLSKKEKKSENQIIRNIIDSHPCQ